MEIVVLLLFMALIPAFIAKSKGHSFWAFYIFGIALWIVALIVAICMGRNRDHEKKCPACAEWVKAEALVCKHCQHNFSTALNNP